MTEEQTYHRSGSSERSGVGNQASQGVLLPWSVDYMSVVRHHDGHLLHHLDSSCPNSKEEERMKKKNEEEEEKQWRRKRRGVPPTGFVSV